MGKIYESMEDYEEAFEKEFKNKVLEVAYYQGDIERTTIDEEWTESELKDDIYDETRKILHGEPGGKSGWLASNIGRAVHNSDLLTAEFIVENICERYDLIEVYNRAYDLHRNDKPMKFGIHYFDEVVKKEVLKILKNNLVTG